MFTPVIPFGGYTGFRFLERTYERQLDTLSKSPEVTRNVEYFLANAAKPQTAEEFVQDRRLMQVALTAFGLEDDIDKRAFVRRILEEGVIDRNSFANRLNDRRYQELASQLGFAEVGSFLNIENRREKIVQLYRERQFERQVGDVDVNMRLALNFRRDIADLADDGLTPTAGWLKVMGTPALREVFEVAFNLPAEFGRIDLDLQVERLQDRSEALLGGKSIDLFTDPAKIEETVKRFLLNAQVREGLQGVTPGSTALTLLQSASLGSQGSFNLFASNFSRITARF